MNCKRFYSTSFRPTLKNISNVKHALMIASGKGGVGKSTVAVNTAIALSLLGQRVGLLDADVCGPSIPQMMNMNSFNNSEFFRPMRNYNIDCMSISFIVENPALPIVWRGLMVTKAIQQLLFQTLWPALDFLLIDTPPGTGDTHLTIAQNVSLSGAIIVSTGQDISLNVVQKGICMLKKVHVPIIGWIKNMSWYECESCHHVHNLFQSISRTKIDDSIPLLGDLPMVSSICQSADQGLPVMVQEDDSHLVKLQKQEYFKIASKLISILNDND